VALTIEPLSGARIRLTEAKVDFWLENEDPATFFERVKSEGTWTLDAAFPATFRFERIAEG